MEMTLDRLRSLESTLTILTKPPAEFLSSALCIYCLYSVELRSFGSPDNIMATRLCLFTKLLSSTATDATASLSYLQL